MKTTNKIPRSLQNINLKAVLRKQGIYYEQAYNRKLKEMATPLAKELIRLKHKPQPIKIAPIQKYQNYTNEQALDYWEKQLHIVDVVEKKFETKVQQFIQKIGDNFISHLDSEVSTHKDFVTFVQKDFFDDNEDELMTEASIDFTPLLDNVAILAGNEANKLIGVKDPYLLTNMRKQIEDNIQFFTKSMLDTDREHLALLITNGLQEGKSIPEIRGMIQEDFSQYSKMQAARITRTEVLRASNQAAVDAYKESGVVSGKEWLTAGADDECADYEGEQVSLDEDFGDGDPPLHPNCRCVILPVLLDEKSFAPKLNLKLHDRIKELEDQIDKRTKAYKTLQEQRRTEKADDMAYIKALEKYLSVDDDKGE